MKNKLFMVCLAATFVACTNYEEKAQVYLQRANDLMKQEAYSEAKLQIDSIRKLYPKAVEARKEGIRIVQQIELKEQNRTLAYLDSVYQAKMAQLDSMKGNYVFEKNAEYQEEGNYFSPSQTVEKNINRTFLRAQVSEKGVMNLTSIYCGKNNIHHTMVKVSSGNTFAQTPSSKDVYETSDLGWKIEKADFVLGQDSSVIDYIVMHQKEPIRVELIGDRTYRTSLLPADKKAIVDVYSLARVLGIIETVKQQQKEARLKLEFVQKKMNGE